MEKASQLLTALKKQSEQQNENISQLHEQNLENLNKNLTDLWSSKLKQIEQSIRKENKTTLENIDHELEILRKNKIYKYIGIALTSLIIGIISTIMIRPYLIPNESQEWIVPQEVRFTHEGTKYIMIKKDNPNLYNGNDNQTKFLKIGD